MRRSVFVAILLAVLAAMGCLLLGRPGADADPVGTIPINSTADTDGDTIPDESDNCPLDPEIIDGELDSDGCPDSDARVVDVEPHSQIDLVVGVSLSQMVTATLRNGNEAADLRITLLDYIQYPECTGDWTPEAGDTFMSDEVDTDGDTVLDRHLSIIGYTYTGVASYATIDFTRERTLICSAYTYPPPCADDDVDATVEVLPPVVDSNLSNNVLRIDHDLCAAGDSDSDGINDGVDNCPDDYNPGQQDADGDDVGDICDVCPDDAGNDADEDGICAGTGYEPPKTDDQDNCPDAYNPGQEDVVHPGDGGDACQDYEPDGVVDADDNCPDDYNPGQEDGDDDGVGDVCDNCPDDANQDQQNSDADIYGDACDNCPTVYNPTQTNTDVIVNPPGDAQGDACDTDDDDDGLADGDDPCPLDPDCDGDTFHDGVDNCPLDPNPGQEDGDGDDVGNICDNCPNDYNADQANSDADTHGDACDNCLLLANEDQTDTDGDDVGDVCDGDDDGDAVIDLQDICPLDVDCEDDGVCDGSIARPETAPGAPPGGCLAGPDNCPLDSNPGQEDADGDGFGDVCDADDDNDGLPDGGDPCPEDPDCDDDSLGLGAPLFWRDGVELFIGTDPLDECADTSTPNDETGAGESPWPPDFNDNGRTDIGDLVLLKNHWVPLGNPYGARYDLNGNGMCDIGDLVILKWYWVGTGHDTCTVG